MDIRHYCRLMPNRDTEYVPSDYERERLTGVVGCFFSTECFSCSVAKILSDCLIRFAEVLLANVFRFVGFFLLVR